LIKQHIINERIRVQEVRLIDEEGQQVGVIPTRQALEQASEKNLDLVLISETARPPVAKIVDYGKYRYQQQKSEKLARKSSRNQVIKEIKMSPKISIHDYQVRVNRGVEFLKKGYKIKLWVWFRGREVIHPELGEAVIKRFLEAIKDLGTADAPMSRSHRSMTVMISPK